MPPSEFSRIDRLSARFGGAPGGGIAVGIGDDAAVLEPPGASRLVWTVDSQVEEVHFRRRWMTLVDVGWRSFVAAASDIAAMGATPWCALSALACPTEMTDDELDELTRGQAEAARALSCPIVGGNLSRGSELSVTTSVVGTCARPVLRSGARPGDGVWIAGRVGMAAAGLQALALGRASSADIQLAVETFRRPPIYRHEALALGAVAHAAIDVSDGLTQDVGHLARASGVAIVLHAAALLEHGGDSLRRASTVVGANPLDLALRGGEDYALVATSDVPIVGFTKIGLVNEGVGVRLARDGVETLLAQDGFDHFDASRR